jgi:hypothetical protein
MSTKCLRFNLTFEKTEWTIKNGQSRMDNPEWTIKNGQSRMDNQEWTDSP